MNKTVEFIRDNPVVVLDIVKYALALLILFGVPVPPGVDIALAGLVVAVLSLVTRSKVTPTHRVGLTPVRKPRA